MIKKWNYYLEKLKFTERTIKNEKNHFPQTGSKFVRFFFYSPRRRIWDSIYKLFSNNIQCYELWQWKKKSEETAKEKKSFQLLCCVSCFHFTVNVRHVFPHHLPLTTPHLLLITLVNTHFSKSPLLTWKPYKNPFIFWHCNNPFSRFSIWFLLGFTPIFFTNIQALKFSFFSFFFCPLFISYQHCLNKVCCDSFVLHCVY